MNSLRSFLDAWLNRRESWVWLLGLGLLLRIAFLIPLYDDPLVGDSLYYHEVAEQLAAGEISDTYWPPGLALYEALIILVFGSSHLAVRIGMLLWFIFLGRATYKLLYRLHSRPAANIALFFLCIYPEFIHHSIEPLTQLPAAALLVALLDRLLQYTEDKKNGLLTGMGIVLALLILLRPSSILVAALVPVWMFARRRSFIAPIYLLLVALGLTGAWVYVSSQAQGRFIPVNEANTRNLYLGNNPWTPDYKTWYLGSHWAGEAKIPAGFKQALDSLEALPAEERIKAYFRATVEHVQGDPARFAWRTANRIRVFFAFDSFTGARLAQEPGAQAWAARLVLGLDALLFSGLMIAYLLVLAGAWKGELAGAGIWLSLALVIVYALPYFVSFSHPTYHLPLMPIFLALAAIPVSRLLLPMGRPLTWPQGRSAWVAGALILLFLSIQVEWLLRMLP